MELDYLTGRNVSSHYAAMLESRN